MKTGVLLINLGTPENPTPEAVKVYLRQFLMDPYVIDISFIPRWFLVNVFIAPFRSKESAESYEKIWTKEGSPLLVYSQKLTEKVEHELGNDFDVKLAMRYGQPSIENALQYFHKQDIKNIIVFPLYPQYAESSTESSLQEVKKVISNYGFKFNLSEVPAFFTFNGYIQAFAEKAKKMLAHKDYDHILFSYHGLPESHIQKLDQSGSYCLKQNNCCEHMSRWNKNCYRAQCFQTTYAIANELRLSKAQYSLSFQSRLGNKPWIKPYTDVVLKELLDAGKKKVLVFCPAFVADCLETIEEIGMREREVFIENGGLELDLVPSLNDSPTWVKAVCDLVKKADRLLPS